jgi:integrase
MIHHHAPPQSTRKACQTVPILFTDLAVRSLKPGTYFDLKTPGFGMRVGKNRKTWIVLKGANRTKVRIGHYPFVTLADARRKAHVVLGSPHHAVSAPSFKDAVQQFLELQATTLKPRSLYELQRTLRRHFHWQKTIDKITATDIAAAIDSISAKGEATHAFSHIRWFFNWCVPRFIAHSPCHGLKAPAKSVSRDRVLTETELVTVWRYAEQVGYPFGSILKLLILTGQRLGEINSLRREYIDANKLTITLPQTKNGRSHSFPYGAAVGKIVESIPRHPSTDLLFPGRNPTKAWNGAHHAKRLLDQHSPMKHWTLHDLRRTFASNLAPLGVQLPTIEKLLNHQSGSFGGIVFVYQRHKWMPEMRAAVAVWQAHLDSLLTSI